MRVLALVALVSGLSAPAFAVDLHQLAAAIHEDRGLPELQELLENEDVNQPLDELTPLFVASKMGSLNSVRALIEMGANPNLRMAASCCSGWTAVNIAAAEQHKDVVDCLLEHGADPNIPNGFGRTPLLFASLYGARGIVESLIAAKADPNVRTDSGGPRVAALAAVERGHIEIAVFLLEHGARVEAEDCRADFAPACGLIAYQLDQLGREKEANPLWDFVCKHERERFPGACRLAK